ncbi:major facilitator superfamily protein [Lacticaseibacillus manihotivorans DSM 13343 = JCM 12514]|uniref:Major facilitator superfamily protein n=2 Tax=Lacticaseibacillus manihotivorans TaxID=88233 RepID=A0A0R1Q769_9LACO|nr:major facilitator superfamily protein [Lacticaseibacillus manihotivorans DSM 13343 = JCM 12514]
MNTSKKLIVMAAVLIATFMTSVEVTIVTTAIPTIIANLHGLAWQSWIMAAYLLTTAITTPIYGKLADTYGRKRLFQWGVAVFTGGSLLSGLSPSIGWLIVARGIQGIGAGAVMPLTFTLIADFFPYEKRAQAMALNNSAWGLSALLGPLLGGFLVDHLSWHWVFFVNVPLGVIVFGLTAFGYHESTTMATKQPLDRQGIAWLTISLVSLLLAAQSLSRSPGFAFGLVIICGIALWRLVKVEQQATSALISPVLFRSKTFVVQIVTACLLSGVLIGYQVYFPIWLQGLDHVNATAAGFSVSFSSIMWLVAGFLVSWTLKHLVPRRLTMAVVVIQAISYGGLVLLGAHFPVWGFYVVAAINGFGMGLVISQNTILAQHLAPKQLVGTATAMLTLGRSLGQTVMTAIYGGVLNVVLQLRRGSVPMRELDAVVAGGAGSLQAAGVLLSALQAVFVLVVMLLAIVWVVNACDPNREVIA